MHKPTASHLAPFWPQHVPLKQCAAVDEIVCGRGHTEVTIALQAYKRAPLSPGKSKSVSWRNVLIKALLHRSLQPSNSCFGKRCCQERCRAPCCWQAFICYALKLIYSWNHQWFLWFISYRCWQGLHCLCQSWQQWRWWRGGQSSEGTGWVR